MNTAAMDGIAIRFGSLQGAAVETGTWQEGHDFVFANTGCGVAPQYDTVIKIENVSFDSNNRPLLHYLPRQKGELLHYPGTQVVQDELLVITGVTILNDTLPQLLAMAKPGAEILVTGPTASMLPEPFFARGVTITGGIIVTKADELLDIISEGSSGYHFFGKYAERSVIKRQATN